MPGPAAKEEPRDIRRMAIGEIRHSSDRSFEIGSDGKDRERSADGELESRNSWMKAEWHLGVCSRPRNFGNQLRGTEWGEGGSNNVPVIGSQTGAADRSAKRGNLAKTTLLEHRFVRGSFLYLL